MLKTSRQNARAALFAASLLASTAHAAVTVTVPGTSNPNLAGRDSGYACCSGDAAPGQAAVEVTGLSLSAGAALTFGVTGETNHSGGNPTGNNPDGTVYGGSPGNFGDGIASPVDLNRIDSLMGVFLGAAAPSAASTPAQLSYASGIGFSTQAPAVGQVFFIGNGLTGDTNAGDFGGQVQQFIVPVGATRLFLGTSDGYGWYNNAGAFNVAVSAVPEPSSGVLILSGALGLALTCVTRRRRSR